MSFITDETDGYGPLLIIYATQSGTAEEYAKKIARSAITRHIEYSFANASDFKAFTLPYYRIVVFIVSTTGEGEMPSSMQELWRFLLQRDLPANWLCDTIFAVFGLGDSSYEKYNYAGKKLHRRLEQLGATFIVERGDGDEQHPLGHDGAFIPWSEGVWRFFEQRFGKTVDLEIRIRASVSVEKTMENPVHLDDPLRHNHQHPLFKVGVRENKRISATDHFQDVRHVVFQGENLPPYKPGDVAILSPSNDMGEVNKLVSVLSWDCYMGIALKFTSLTPWMQLSPTLSQPITIETLLKQHMDIIRAPSRYFFEILHSFVSPDHPDANLHKEKLAELASSQGIDLYLEYVWRCKRKPLEVLLDFTSVRIPLDYVFDLFPLLQPREYSISSAFIETPSEIHLTAALVEYRTSFPTPRYGVCSRWLRDLTAGTDVFIGIRSGTWKISQVGPIVLIAAGTGIAPLRAIIHHTNHGDITRPMYLFFGCRFLSKDFHYHEEWFQLSRLGSLVVYALGSRDIANEPRKYLPDLLYQHSVLLKTLLYDDSTTFYLSGNSKLPKAIKLVLADIAGNPSFPESMVKSGRFFIETWS